MNGGGDITSLRIKWPKINKLPQTYVPASYDLEFNSILGIFSDSSATIKDTKTIHKINGTIIGAAKAWHKIDLSGRSILSPCFIFQTDFLMDNGEHTTLTLTPPALQKYYPDYK